MRMLFSLVVILVATMGGRAQSPADYGDYNRSTPAPDPRIDALIVRIGILEQQRVQDAAKLDAILAAVTKSGPAPVNPTTPASSSVVSKQVATLRSPQGHTHTCAAGHSWDHTANSTHNCTFPVPDGSGGTRPCGLFQNRQDPVPQMVKLPPSDAATAAVGTSYSYQSFQSISGAGGCANGQCAAPQSSARHGLFGWRR